MQRTVPQRYFTVTGLIVAVLSLGLASGAWLPSAGADIAPLARVAADQAGRGTRGLKVSLLNALTSPPRLLVFGGSRAMKAEPSYLTARTGLPSFNASVTSCRPPDVWALANYAHDQFPGTEQHHLWFLSMEALRATGMVQAELLTVPALSTYLSPHVRSGRPAYGVLPRSDGTVWDQDGWLRLSHYQIGLAHGATLARNLRGKIDQYTTTYRTQFTRLYSRPERFVARTIAKMNEWGSTPVIVLPPYHPALLKALKRCGWDARHREVLGFFKKLHRSCDFVLLDMTAIDSFGGRQSGFYDGVHMKAGTMRQLLGRVLDKAGWALR